MVDFKGIITKMKKKIIKRAAQYIWTGKRKNQQTLR